MRLFLEVLWHLALFDFYLSRRDFAALHKRVYKSPTRRIARQSDAVGRVCDAVDFACMWYPKRSLCLQRSAALTCLLRRHGVPALMVIGVQKLPFKAHAWVEVDGRVINDKPYVREMYAILDRC